MKSGDHGLESEANVRPRPCLTRAGQPRGCPGARWTAIDRGLSRDPLAQARLDRSAKGAGTGHSPRYPKSGTTQSDRLLAGAAVNGANAHIVPLLTDRGFTPVAATGIFGVMGLSTLVVRPFVGLLLDRVFAPQVAAAFFLAPLAGLPLLASGSGLSPAIGAALLGLALGAEIDLIAFLTTRYLGQRAFGEIYGYLFMAFILGASVGGFSADVSFDRSGSYTPALIGYAGALVGAAFLVNRLGPYVYTCRGR